MKKLDMHHITGLADENIKEGADEFMNFLYCTSPDSDLVRETEAFKVGAKWMQAQHDWIPICKLPIEPNHRNMILKGKRGGLRLVKNFTENYAKYLASYSDHTTHFKYIQP